MSQNSPFRYLLLYLPFFISSILEAEPHISYFISWSGSFFIFYFSLSGFIKPLPKDLPITEQLLRPIFLMQIIFAGYMCTSSIFYYLNALGYKYADYVGYNIYFSTNIFKSIAKCQSYYVLGHAALVTGILVKMKYPIKSKYTLYTSSMSNLLLAISLICLPLSYLCGLTAALSQFSIQLGGISFVAGTVAFTFAIREHNKINMWIGFGLFVLNFLHTLVSGFKEPIIIAVLLLGIFLLPIYGKKIAPLFIAILVGLIFVLPTFIGNYRSLAREGASAEEARDKSLDLITKQTDINDLKDDNWAFLTMRLSEIDMFINFTNSTPQFVPHYKIQIVHQGLFAIVPRVIWRSKPNTEQMVMDRVYKAGVIDERSLVSAKPAFIVDCYLSWGAKGVFIGLFLFGWIAQFISAKAEYLFGGYFMGTAIIFTGLFQIFWRGNCFEFIISTVFWSFITMFIFLEVFKAKGILEPLGR
ncbi:MAG: hypothetical protein EOP00_04185 [Pedobacter sp.]|nr:MAG: hypothetical protein EOP00_04185 [Pedobacter sp.]